LPWVAFLPFPLESFHCATVLPFDMPMMESALSQSAKPGSEFGCNVPESPDQLMLFHAARELAANTLLAYEPVENEEFSCV